MVDGIRSMDIIVANCISYQVRGVMTHYENKNWRFLDQYEGNQTSWILKDTEFMKKSVQVNLGTDATKNSQLGPLEHVLIVTASVYNPAKEHEVYQGSEKGTWAFLPFQTEKDIKHIRSKEDLVYPTFGKQLMSPCDRIPVIRKKGQGLDFAIDQIALDKSVERAVRACDAGYKVLYGTSTQK